MILVDNIPFSEDAFHRRYSQLGQLDVWRKCHGNLYAICLKHPFDVISAVLYLREHGGGALLLHESTPYESAQKAARQASANYLIYETLDRVEPIEGIPGEHASALYQYSSGTTGQPKLISRPWNAIGKEIGSYNDRLSPEGEGNPLILVPVSHSFGLITGVLAALARGAKPHIVQDKNPKFALRLIRETTSSIVYAVPFLLHLLLTLGKEESRFHELVSSGAPLSEMLLHRLTQRANRVWHQYGCSEAGCIALGADPSSPFEVGRPLAHVQASCEPLSSGNEPSAEMQEIVISSEGTLIHTQDIGYLSDAGSLFVMGRSDDLINVSGLKVIPSEVETVIGRMKGVVEAVVYKTPHRIWGESVKAMVVASEDVSENDLRAFCIQSLPNYKVPSVIEFILEIPKLPNGKVSRKLLIEQENRV